MEGFDSNQTAPVAELGGVKKEIEQSALDGDNSENSATYFIFGVALAVICSIIPILILHKTKEATVFSLNQQIQEEVTTPLQTLTAEQKTQQNIVAEIEALTAALNSKVQNSKIIELLSSNQLKNSQWVSFSQVSEGKITISEVVSSFDDIPKVFAAYRKATGVENVTLSNADVGEDGKITFSANLTVDPGLFKIAPVKATIESLQSNAGTTQGAAVPLYALTPTSVQTGL